MERDMNAQGVVWVSPRKQEEVPGATWSDRIRPMSDQQLQWKSGNCNGGVKQAGRDQREDSPYSW